MTDIEVRTYEIERSTTPTRWVYTAATWDPATGLRLTNEVDYEADETGPAAETEAVYRVGLDRIDELLASLPQPFGSMPVLLEWASTSPLNALVLTRALGALEPSVMVYHRLS